MNILPIEFQRMPSILPPNLATPNTQWLVCDSWRAPTINGKQVCVRGSLINSDGSNCGFWTDGVSIPQLGWSIIGITPLSMPGLCWALGHDISYAAELVPKATCDNWLYEWAKMANVSDYKRDMCYWAVDHFGQSVWDAHTPQSIADARIVCQLVDEGKDPIWPEWPASWVE